jgi:Icc-related predicted phosphoesterase
MEVLFSSDLHGEIHLYQQLPELILSSSVEVVALGGDLLPSFSPSRHYEDMIPNQRTFIDQFFLPFFDKLVETTSIQSILLIPGNWDLGYSYLFQKPAAKIVDLDRKNILFENGYELIGYPFVPPTPFRPKDFEKMDDHDSPWPPQKKPSYIRAPDREGEIAPVDPHLFLRQRDTIQDDLDRLPKPHHFSKAIYIMHSPPFGTQLDLIQGKKFAGSRSIRTFIQKQQPLLTLHGHIHESPEISGTYLDRIGETLSVNPGQFSLSDRESRRLHAVTFEMENIEETLRHTCFK